MSNSALLAAIQGLVLNKEGDSVGHVGYKMDRDRPINDKNKPSGPWRNKKEFENLMKRGLCIRCGKQGHSGRFCPTFRPALRPDSSIGAMDEWVNADLSKESGKGEP